MFCQKYHLIALIFDFFVFLLPTRPINIYLHHIFSMLAKCNYYLSAFSRNCLPFSHFMHSLNAYIEHGRTCKIITPLIILLFPNKLLIIFRKNFEFLTDIYMNFIYLSWLRIPCRIVLNI